MSTRSPANQLWEAHLERLRQLNGGLPPAALPPRARRAPIGDHEANDAVSGEWSAAPPGRLGRRLIADVEAYLAFFAIARA